MKKILVLLLSVLPLAGSAQNWSPLSKKAKQYFITIENPSTSPNYGFGPEVFINQFNTAAASGNDSVYFQSMCKPLLRGGHSDRAADFLCFRLIQTDSSYIMAHRKLTASEIVFDPMYPDYYKDTLLQDTFNFHFRLPFKIGQYGLRVMGQTLDYKGLVTSLKDTIIQGENDSIATIVLGFTGIPTLNGKLIRISKNHGIILFRNLVRGGEPITQYLESDARQKFDFTQQERRKLGPGDELHIYGSSLDGYSQSLDGFEVLETKLMYKILDTSQAGVHVHRLYWAKYQPSHDPDVFEYLADVTYWTDTLNNNSHPFNITPELGLIKDIDTNFKAAGYPVRTYISPIIQKLWVNGTLNFPHSSFNEQEPLKLGGLVPDFHSPHLIYSPYRYADEQHDWAVSSTRTLVFSQINNVQRGTPLTIPTSIQERGSAHFRLFPNPGTGKLNIRLPQFQPDARISIVNMMGQTLMTIQDSFLEKSLDINHLPAGLYTVRVESDGKIQQHKLVKK